MMYDVVCPKCGRTNRNLYLDETGGYMECEYCHKAVYVAKISAADCKSAMDDKIQEGKGEADINGAI